jgi:hypothetical protein
LAAWIFDPFAPLPRRQLGRLIKIPKHFGSAEDRAEAWSVDEGFLECRKVP